MLTSKEIKRINRVRDILGELEDRCEFIQGEPELRPWEVFRRGQMATLANAASDALFDLLNLGNATSMIAMTEDQLHNRKEEVAP